MPRAKSDQSKVLEDVAAFILENGLSRASLRPMAKAAGTTDRLLIYHFGTKDQLMEKVLTFLAEGLASQLAANMVPVLGQDERSLVSSVVKLMRRAELRPYILLWIEIAAAAARGDQMYAKIAAEITRIFLDWTRAQTAHVPAQALRTFALIEGFTLMDSMGSEELTDQALNEWKRAP